MSINQGVVEFTSTVTTITVSRGAGGTLVTTLNVEGASQAYGPFVGTITVTGANKGGSWHYEAFAVPADGSNLTGSADGSYESVSQGRWKTPGVGTLISEVGIQNFRLEAEFDLAKRSWNGRLSPI